MRRSSSSGTRSVTTVDLARGMASSLGRLHNYTTVYDDATARAAGRVQPSDGSLAHKQRQESRVGPKQLEAGQSIPTHPCAGLGGRAQTSSPDRPPVAGRVVTMLVC